MPVSKASTIASSVNGYPWPKHYSWLEDYMLAKAGAVKDYQPSWRSHRFLVGSKLFAFTVKDSERRPALNLKCDPMLALDYRSRFQSIQPGYHMNKVHWISLLLKGKTPDATVMELVDISYALVFSSLNKVKRAYITDVLSL